jgi:hypothetical protein
MRRALLIAASLQIDGPERSIRVLAPPAAVSIDWAAPLRLDCCLRYWLRIAIAPHPAPRYGGYCKGQRRSLASRETPPLLFAGHSKPSKRRRLVKRRYAPIARYLLDRMIMPCSLKRFVLFSCLYTLHYGTYSTQNNAEDGK